MTATTDRPRVRDRLLGGPSRLGWWTLPLFVAVGLLGAVLAGSLAVVYYSQRVAGLENETATARRDLTGAAERVNEAADEAVAAIQSEAEAVREELAASFPVEDPAAVGLVAVRVDVPPAAGPTPGGGGGITRLGSGVTVVSADGNAFLLTALGLLDAAGPGDETVDGGRVLLRGQAVDAWVHAIDPARDIGLLRVDGAGDAPVPPWRPVDAGLEAGDRLFAAGLTADGVLVQAQVSVAAVEPQRLLVDRALPPTLRGAPLFDAEGRVAGLLTATDGTAVPIRALCEQLVRCAAGDVGAG